MESETRSSSESNERPIRSSRNRTESPRPGAKENSEKDKIPPPPPKGAKTKDESVCKYNCTVHFVPFCQQCIIKNFQLKIRIQNSKMKENEKNWNSKRKLTVLKSAKLLSEKTRSQAYRPILSPKHSIQFQFKVYHLVFRL